MATDRSDKIDVLFVVPAISYEGISKVVLLQIGGLLKEKYRVKLLSLTDVDREVLQVLAPWLPAVDMEELWQPEPYLSVRSLRSSFAAALKVKLLLARHRPAIVFAHAPYSHFILRLALALSIGRNKVKLWQYFHVMQYTEFPLITWKRKAINMVNRYLARFFDYGHVFVSEAVKAEIQANLTTIRRSHVVYNALPFAATIAAGRRSTRTSQDKFRVLLPGRIEHRKGQLWFLGPLKAFMHHNTVDSSQVEVIIAGDGEQKQQLLQAVTASGLQDNVKLTGNLPNDELTRYMGESTVVVVPSFAEGLPMVLLEALQQGALVLASDIAPNREIIQEGTGLLFKAGDANDCVTQLLNIYHRRYEPLVEYEKIAEHLQTRFSFKKHMQNLIAIIEHG